jgi:hypothetical protein
MAPRIAKRALSVVPILHELAFRLKYYRKPLPVVWGAVSGAQVDDNMPKKFGAIFENNSWQDPISKSGPGSNPSYTKRLRWALPALVKKYGISSMLDAPCGDFVWMKDIIFPTGFQYFGCDIVKELVYDLQEKYGSATRKFAEFDIVSDKLPNSDLWLCRDCFIHLPNAYVFRALENFARSEIPYLLASNYHYGASNPDVVMGGFRLINLQVDPFFLPKPIDSIIDYVYPFPARRLSLWSRSQVRKSIENSSISRQCSARAFKDEK